MWGESLWKLLVFASKRWQVGVIFYNILQKRKRADSDEYVPSGYVKKDKHKKGRKAKEEKTKRKYKKREVSVGLLL